jgi:acetyltransferase-like isoleucine patch superfamily enzyme
MKIKNEPVSARRDPLTLSDLPYFKDYQIVRDGEFETPSYRGLPNKKVILCAFGDFDPEKFNTEHGVSCVIADEKMGKEVSDQLGLVITAKPMECLIGLHLYLHEKSYYKVDQASEIDESAFVHPTAWVDPTGVIIGPESEVGPNAVLYSGTIVGKSVKIGANVTIGSQGFDVRNHQGKKINMPHVGRVELHDHSEIQANAAVAKALFDDATVIGEGTTMAHSSFVSHGSKIGRHVRIAPGAVVCGGVTVGNDVWIGPNATVSNGVKVGDGAFISIGSTLVGSLEDKDRAYGHFAVIKKV